MPQKLLLIIATAVLKEEIFGEIEVEIHTVLFHLACSSLRDVLDLNDRKA